ncbi:hypothetical protein CABS01_10440 [Colletotrichum abscissum]|uniref:Uncharacterized protein n=1 Tax=Colletotrichum abscissum TaxID=1671311 RepID=A0A9P9X244_9PEZI|nr:uncharacterized protein CABS01_10440 [Colletotrichum abscissum]KAI3531787.1 hypothetical protein CABS02_14056 [Colletotrichum abscissum]KAK1498665.1 hypothetical protein CABS01_10440 [Colletotrichum abscissum]
MHLLGRVSLCLLLSAHGTHSENRFRRPPGPGPSGDFRDNPVYPLGTQLDLQWETDFTAIDLIIWHEATYPKSEATYASIISNTRALGMLWTVSFNGFPSHHDSTLSPVYFIQMFNHSASVGDITCHYFNITNSVASTSATTSTSPTSTASTLTAVATLVEASPTASPGSSGMNNGASTGVVAGITVGVVLGTLAIMGLVGWVIWRHLRKKKQGHESGDAGASDVGNFSAVQEIGPSPPLRWKYELPMNAQQHRYEADGTEVVRYEMASELGSTDNENKTLRVRGDAMLREP